MLVLHQKQRLINSENILLFVVAVVKAYRSPRRKRPTPETKSSPSYSDDP